MDILLILFLTLLNGAFAMSEMALAASRKSRLQPMADDGDKGSQAALDLMEHPTQFLSSVQVGITSIGMLNGIVGEAAFSGSLAAQLNGWGMGVEGAEVLATVIVVVVITFVTIVFGELVPKRVGQMYPEAVARWVSRPMKVVARAAKPFVALLTLTTQAVLRALGVNSQNQPTVTEAEINASLEEGVDAGVIEAQEHRMVRNVFALDDRQLASIMVPRSDIEWLDAQATIGEAVNRAWASGHSWYPVCRGGLDDVVGVVHLPELLRWQAEGRHETLAAVAAPASFVPETLSGLALLEQFRARSMRMTFVVDEYGVVQGMLTPLDLLEAITGELQPEEAVDAWATQRPDGSWDVDGAMPAAELKSRLGVDEWPDEDKGRYNTVAGLMQSVAGDLLGEEQWVDCAGWRMQVLGCEGRRIDKVWVYPLAHIG